MTDSTPRIYLLTDDRSLTSLVGEGFGETVQLVLGGAGELLDSIELEEAALLLVDAEQSDAGSGYVLLRALRSSGSMTPVVGLVEDDQIDAAIAFVRLGATDALKKPVRPAELWRTVKRLLPEVA